MDRIELNEEAMENVVGGTIVFNGDHTTCGRDCNNQYNVKNYDAAIDYILANRGKMSEKSMLNNMASLGYITKIEF